MDEKLEISEEISRELFSACRSSDGSTAISFITCLLDGLVSGNDIWSYLCHVERDDFFLDDDRSYYCSPLAASIRSGNKKLWLWMREQDWFPKSQDIWNKTFICSDMDDPDSQCPPIYDVSCLSDNLPMLQLLLNEIGMNPNQAREPDEVTSLMHTCYSNDHDILYELLLHPDSNVFSIDSDGFWALHCAAQGDAGANSSSLIPLCLLLRHLEEEKKSVDELSVWVNRQDRWGDTPLHHTVGLKNGHDWQSKMAVLMCYGADGNIHNQNGQPPLSSLQSSCPLIRDTELQPIIRQIVHELSSELIRVARSRTPQKKKIDSLQQELEHMSGLRRKLKRVKSRLTKEKNSHTELRDTISHQKEEIEDLRQKWDDSRSECDDLRRRLDLLEERKSKQKQFAVRQNNLLETRQQDVVDLQSRFDSELELECGNIRYKKALRRIAGLLAEMEEQDRRNQDNMLTKEAEINTLKRKHDEEMELYLVRERELHAQLQPVQQEEKQNEPLAAEMTISTIRSIQFEKWFKEAYGSPDGELDDKWSDVLSEMKNNGFNDFEFWRKLFLDKHSDQSATRIEKILADLGMEPKMRKAFTIKVKRRAKGTEQIVTHGMGLMNANRICNVLEKEMGIEIVDDLVSEWREIIDLDFLLSGKSDLPLTLGDSLRFVWFCRDYLEAKNDLGKEECDVVEADEVPGRRGGCWHEGDSQSGQFFGRMPDKSNGTSQMEGI